MCAVPSILSSLTFFRISNEECARLIRVHSMRPALNFALFFFHLKKKQNHNQEPTEYLRNNFPPYAQIDPNDLNGKSLQ